MAEKKDVFLFNGFDLFSFCEGLLECLHVIFVCKGLKEMARITVRPEKVIRLMNYCVQNNLFCKLSDFKVIISMEKGKGKYHNSAHYVAVDSRAGNYLAYISKKKYSVEQNFNVISDEDMGRLLGYPKCCIKFYMANLAKAMKNQFDFFPMAIRHITAPFFLNYALRYFNVALISHFPCSMDCEHSIGIARTNLDFLAREYPHLAMRFKELLSSFVIYGGHYGVFYTSVFRKESSAFGTRVKFSNLHYTEETDLLRELTTYGEVDLIDYDKIKIGSRIYYGEYLRAVIFDG